MASTTTSGMKVRDIMTREPVSVSPSTTLRELARLLDSNEISGAPVVDAQDHVLGVVSKTDIIHRCLEGAGGSRGEGLLFNALEDELEVSDEMLLDEMGIVEDFMNPDPITAREDEPIGEVARRMADESVHRIIVVDEKGFLAGIVTSIDLLRVFPVNT